MASFEVSFTVSATAINQMALEESAKIITVFHEDSRFSIIDISANSILLSARSFLVHKKYDFHPTIHFTHPQGIASKSSTRIFRALTSCQCFTIDSAKGCSDFCSRDAAIDRISFSDMIHKSTISVTFGFHSVIVHVLSNTMAFIWQAVSSGSHHFIRIQFWAHLQVQTIIAVGVASPSAQGQAITITAEK
ncbi:MAG: hypothetical protein ACD_3C00025G0001 [uncultured bacterium (gcode 4)]|uniref:Uncharacterized protein n=1 Tax=uncultured bacterium (gcode 4) TaxID=1234023 RepID=K2G351_9BACT|nr:MAG: hypothetical protein ACD_3C00025G0001 [uncultured bacterium (gcode 4)]